MHIRCLFNQYDDICMRVSVADGTFNEVGTTENHHQSLGSNMKDMVKTCFEAKK